MIAKLQAMLGMDASKFNAGTKKAGNSVDKFGKGLGKIKGLIAGAFAVGAIVAFGRKLLKMADDMQTAANTFNVSMNTMLALKAVTAESGIETETFLKILGNLKSTQGEVQRGTATYKDAVKALHMTIEDFISLPVDDLLEKLAERYIEAGEGSKEFNAICLIFGKRVGLNLIEVFKRLNGEGGLEGYRKKTEAAAKSTERLAKASDDLEHAQEVGARTGTRALGIWANFVDFYSSMIAHKGDLTAIWDVEELQKSTKEIERATRKMKEMLAARMALAKTEVEAPRKEMEAAFEEHEKVWKKINESQLTTQEKIKKLEKEKADIAEKSIKAQDAELVKLDTRELIVQDKLDKLKEKQRKADEKKQGNFDSLTEKALKQSESYEKNIAALRAGKGIGSPDMARVSRLQAIGGVVGRASGVGDQAARIAERQMAMQEARKQLDIERNKEIVALKKEFHDATEGE